MGYLGIVPSLYPYFKDTHNMNQVSALFVSSLIASSIAITLSHPFDTMKTNLQGDLGMSK